jgi:hypothetical protein
MGDQTTPSTERSTIRVAPVVGLAPRGVAGARNKIWQSSTSSKNGWTRFGRAPGDRHNHKVSPAMAMSQRLRSKMVASSSPACGPITDNTQRSIIFFSGENDDLLPVESYKPFDISDDVFQFCGRRVLDHDFFRNDTRDYELSQKPIEFDFVNLIVLRRISLNKPVGITAFENEQNIGIRFFDLVPTVLDSNTGDLFGLDAVVHVPRFVARRNSIIALREVTHSHAYNVSTTNTPGHGGGGKQFFCLRVESKRRRVRFLFAHMANVLQTDYVVNQKHVLQKAA